MFLNTERTVLLEDLKILLDTNLKIVLLDHQNNFVENLKLMSITAVKRFDFLGTSLNFQQNHFQICIQQNF